MRLQSSRVGCAHHSLPAKYYQVGGGETINKGTESPEFEAKIGGFRN